MTIGGSRCPNPGRTCNCQMQKSHTPSKQHDSVQACVTEVAGWAISSATSSSLVFFGSGLRIGVLRSEAYVGLCALGCFVRLSIDLAVPGVAGADIFASGVSAACAGAVGVFAGVPGLALGSAGFDLPFTLASKAAAEAMSWPT